MNGSRVALLVLWVGCAGCSLIGNDRDAADGEPRLAEVVGQLPEAELAAQTLPPPARADVIAAYSAVEGRVEDPALDLAIGRRMAELTLSVAEDQHADGAAQPYAPAIERYTALAQRTEGAERAEVLYQLARAHDMAGDAAAAIATLDRLIADHPDHRLVVEARFRRGEMAFSAERWAAAETDYAWVVSHGRDSPWWLNAAYMSGWSTFKDGTPELALERFFLVLDTLHRQAAPTRALPDGPATAAASVSAGVRAAGRTDQHELRADTLRVTTLALDYLAGPATLAETMRAHALPAWQYDVYGALADSYLARERYLDSVTTWQTFIDEQPLDPRAPTAHRKVVDILRDADFPTEARESQARFVAAYGIDSAFWAQHDPSVRAGYLQTLKQYLDELAQASHAAAQASGDAADFASAARWYEELIRTFPDAADAAGYLFMLGEVQTEAGNTAQAVAAYQRVLRDHPEFPQAAEAGYAAILGLDALAAAGDPAGREPLVRARIASQIEFAEYFPADTRAPAVRAAAADGLFALGDHAGAAAQAEAVLAAPTQTDPGLRTTALTVLGHARFELGDHPGSEQAYRELLNAGIDDDLRGPVTERLQAAVYRQAEASERDGAIDAAIAHYLRVGDVAGDSELAIQARYDAIAVLENAGRVGEAARQLDEFRTRHGGHPLAADAPRRLATLWEQSGDGSRAGGAWLEVAETDGDPEIRRQALYRAGELALQNGAPAAATQHFALYAERYPEPADLRMEALDQLDKLAHAAGDRAQQRRWFAAKIELERAMRGAAWPEPTLARARQLAAAAQYELARDARLEFDAVHLVDPLAESLERKQAALLAALAAFENTAAYEVADYVTASTWEIGDLYAALARALMTSERPADLPPEALEEYELLLEEQAFPFEEQAIAVHEINLQRSWTGRWDAWIERSFADLRRLVPARFDRTEQQALAGTAEADACAAGIAQAIALRQTGDFAGAERHYLGCIERQPDCGPAWFNLGILYELYLGRPDAALDAYRRYQALAIEPDPQVAGWMQQIERRAGT